MNQNSNFSIYLYDSDNGQLIGVDHGFHRHNYKAQASVYHHDGGYLVKVIDASDNAVVYTLG